MITLLLLLFFKSTLFFRRSSHGVTANCTRPSRRDGNAMTIIIDYWLLINDTYSSEVRLAAIRLTLTRVTRRFFAAVTTMIGCLSLFLGAIRASSKLHEYLLGSTFRWLPIIFDRTPAGRIINRFGYDVDVLDNSIAQNFRHILISVGSVRYATLFTYVSYLFLNLQNEAFHFVSPVICSRCTWATLTHTHIHT